MTGGGRVDTDRASDRYSVELVGKRPSALKWIWAFFQASTGTTPDGSDSFEIRFTDRSTGTIAFRETYEGNLAADEALKIAETDLEQMTVAELAEKYGFEVVG